MLRDRAERVAVADRQAELTAAITLRAEDYTPLDVTARIAEFDRVLATGPDDTEEARVERRIRELMEA